MAFVQTAKWIVGILVAGLALLLASIFVADRQLEAPFPAAELAPLSVPAADPLGSSLVLYNSNPDGNHEIYASAGGGSFPMQLTLDPSYDSWRPRISPDRSTVLFYRTPSGTYDRDDTQATLWMMDASGDGLVEVLPLLAHGWLAQGHAEWAPSGQELVMVGSRPSGRTVWITSVDGRDIRSVTSSSGYNGDPSWSPDGRRIIYVSCPQVDCEQAEREVFVVLAAGGDRTQLTTNNQSEHDPQFSPDGEQIVMRVQEQGPDEDGENAVSSIRVMPTNRSEQPGVLADSVGAAGAPRWLTDQMVMFELDGDIVTAHVDGEWAIAPLLQSGAIEAYPTP